jgi:uncharacterized membrane protein YbhN (UPF0104 family)
MSIIALYFVAFPQIEYSNAIKSLVIIFAIILACILLAIFFLPQYFEKIISSIPYSRIRNFILTSFHAFRDGFSHGLSYWSTFLTAAVWVGSLGLYWLFLQFDGGIDLDFGQALIVFIVGTLGISITITPGGIGTFEAAIVFILQYYGYSIESAMASAIGLRMVAFLPNALIASYAVVYEGFDFVTARREAKALGLNDVDS